MKMPITGKRKKQLNEKQCFDLWLDLGSLKKVSKKITREGQINENTGEPFTLEGIRKSALRYLIYRPEDARVRMEEADPFSPYLQSDREWHKFLVERAFTVFSSLSDNDRIYRWAEENGVPKQYIEEELYKNRTSPYQQIQG